MNEPSFQPVKRRFDQFFLNRESLSGSNGNPARLLPECSFKMVGFWREILDCAPRNLTSQYGGALLDARGITVHVCDATFQFEVHAREVCGKVKFDLFQVHGVNGSRRLESIKSSYDLGLLLAYLRDLP